MTYYRNKKLLNAANGAPCMLCGIEDNTIVAAHANGYAFGKGGHLKAPDYFVAYLCYFCHTKIDQSMLSREERDSLWLEAYLKTISYWFEQGILYVK